MLRALELPKLPSNAIVVEMLSQALGVGMQLTPAHAKREFNTWTAVLLKSRFKDFDLSKRLWPDLDPPNWVVLDALSELRK